jgi:catechol 2,3-dioxygenase-like lactoylglutathione lyase family enzyme
MQRTIDTLVGQFERGKLTRRQLVQGLLMVVASPALAQERPTGAFRATGIDHVQITVDDLKATQQFYEKLFGSKGRLPNPTQLILPIGMAGDYISAHSENGPIKPIDHFGITVEGFSQDAALATIERVVPGTKTEKFATTSIFLTGPDGVRVQIGADTKK